MSSDPTLVSRTWTNIPDTDTSTTMCVPICGPGANTLAHAVIVIPVCLVFMNNKSPHPRYKHLKASQQIWFLSLALSKVNTCVTQHENSYSSNKYLKPNKCPRHCCNQTLLVQEIISFSSNF